MNKKKIYIAIGILLIASGIFFFRPKDTAVEIPKPTEESVVVLESSKWVWEYTELLNNKRFDAPEGEKFVLELSEGRFSGTTDCNNISGSYVKNEEVLSFGPIGATKKYCEGSVENEYKEQLALTNSYYIEGDELFLILNRDFGTMVFVKK